MVNFNKLNVSAARMPYAVMPRAIALAGLLTMLTACTPPPPPASARANMQRRAGDEDENDAWLWKKVTKQTKLSDDSRVDRTALNGPNTAQAQTNLAPPANYNPSNNYRPAGAYAQNNTYSQGNAPQGNYPPPTTNPNPYGYSAGPKPAATTPAAGYWQPPQRSSPPYVPSGYTAPVGGDLPQNQGGYSSSPANANNGWTPATSQPYQPSGAVTTRFQDPNVVPVGATDVAPSAGSQGPQIGLGTPPPAAPLSNATGSAAAAAVPPASADPIVVTSESAKKKTDDEGEWDLSQLAPDVTWDKFKGAVGWGPDEKIARAAYDKGQALYRDKKYAEAAAEFYTATWRWPDSTMEEDAMFLMAESYFFADDYGHAEDSYTNLLKKHDNTRYLDTVVNRLFAIGTYWEQVDLKSHRWPVTPNATDKTQPWFDTFGNALACYQAVWLHDPTGPMADIALMRVANAHFRREEWEDAAYHYDLIRKNHPKSKYQKEAHLLELQAKLRIYQGAKYSVVPLNDAQDIADQTLKQFHGQLGEEEARVRETRARLVEQRAEREWTVGQFYDSKKQFRAAKEYYKVILEKYPTSQYAEKARTRLQEVQNEPDEPPNRFAWLTTLFGKEK